MGIYCTITYRLIHCTRHDWYSLWWRNSGRVNISLSLTWQSKWCVRLEFVKIISAVRENDMLKMYVFLMSKRGSRTAEMFQGVCQKIHNGGLFYMSVWGNDTCTHSFLRKTQGVDKRIIFKLTSDKEGEKIWTVFNWLRMGPFVSIKANFMVHKRMEYFDQLNTYQCTLDLGYKNFPCKAEIPRKEHALC